MTQTGMLTTADGPVVVSPRSMRALLAIRRAKLLPQVYGDIAITASARDALGDDLQSDGDVDWLAVLDDRPDVDLPPRLAHIADDDGATLRCALGHGASLVLIEEPAKEKAKLSFIKCEGVVAFLVVCHRVGLLTDVKPMIKALRALGHDAVLPPQEQLDALYEALDALEES